MPTKLLTTIGVIVLMILSLVFPPVAVVVGFVGKLMVAFLLTVLLMHIIQ